MADLEDARRMALALPETTETISRGDAAWRVKDKTFVWERPLRKTDLKHLGDDAPEGEILGAWVEHVGAKEALIADDPAVFFTTPHFDGYAAVLIVLDAIELDELEEIVTDSWLAKAPKRLAAEFLAR